MEKLSCKERRQEIIKAYREKVPPGEIAKNVGLHVSQVYRITKQEIDAGRLEKVPMRRGPKAEKKKEPKETKEKELPNSDPEEIPPLELKNVTECEPIRCTKNVSRHCRYGATNGECNFVRVTGKCRTVTNKSLNFIGCSTDACIRFQKIDKEHPPYFKRKE